jgi:hypothetical protein
MPTIDAITGTAHTPTARELSAALAITFATAEAIREAREIPSGTLYTMLMSKVDFAGYQCLLGTLTKAGLIEVRASHMIVWTGPELEDK